MAGPAARGMYGVLRPGMEAEDSLLNRTMSGPGQVARNLGGSALAGLLGMPGDLNAMFPKFLVDIPDEIKDRQGPLPLPTSEQLQDKFGVEANRPESFVGLVGAPDPMDLARAGGKGLLAMTLFHGTPHKFDRFALDKIGTGEGAQAYGHGLYFAENPGVARHYQETLGNTVSFRGKTLGSLTERKGGNTELNFAAKDILRQVQDNYNMPEEGLQNIVDVRLGKLEDDLAENLDAIKYFKEEAAPADLWDGWEAHVDELQRMADEQAEAIKILEGAQPEDFGVAGHLYEVDIPDEITDRMLDWDAPLSEQPESVRDVLQGIYPDDWTGEQIYRASADDARFGAIERGESAATTLPGSQQRASESLRDLGIPGIRYFDNQSRGAGEGTRNIVVFNPDDITSVKRDGELVWENRSGIRPD